MVQNKVFNVFAKWKDHSEELNNAYAAIQTMSKHFMSSLHCHQAVHKHYSSKPQTDWVAEKVESPLSHHLFPDRFPMLGC